MVVAAGPSADVPDVVVDVPLVVLPCNFAYALSWTKGCCQPHCATASQRLRIFHFRPDFIISGTKRGMEVYQVIAASRRLASVILHLLEDVQRSLRRRNTIFENN